MTTKKYDIIGDIHAHADELEALLGKLGYAKNEQGTYFAPEPNRQAIFTGDFIDRGKANFRVLRLVRAMVDAGSAQAIMGNHDLNAVLYHSYEEVEGKSVPLRPHDHERNTQHKTFLEEMPGREKEAESHLAWMKNLPLMLELEGSIRCVHALWERDAIRLLRAKNILLKDNRINPEKWKAISIKGSSEFEAVELIAKGMEVPLPEGVSFLDSYGIKRERARLKWWGKYDDPDLTLDKAVLSVPAGRIPTIPATPEIRQAMQRVQPTKHRVFFGHYWQEGEHPIIEIPTAICMDQSIAKGGYLAAATVQVVDDKMSEPVFTSVGNFKRQSLSAAR